MSESPISRPDSVPADLWDSTSHDHRLIIMAQQEKLSAVGSDMENFMKRTQEIISDDRADTPGTSQSLMSEFALLLLKSHHATVGMDNIMWKVLWEHTQRQRDQDRVESEKKQHRSTIISIVSAIAAVGSALAALARIGSCLRM